MAPKTAEARLAELRREVEKAIPPPPHPRSETKSRRRETPAIAVLSSAVIALLKVTAVTVLPFLVYVRASVYAYQHLSASPWVSLLFGAALTMALVAAYATWLSGRLARRARVARVATIARWVALPLAAGWCLYAAFYLARVNAKTDTVRGYYSAVHPVLRVALSTVILMDPDLVITDTQRSPADYVRMGLRVNDRTYHYMQSDGWVHAVDLRTRERGAIENRAVQLYFWMMGFSTLRHVGTADHLHVQLMSQ